MESLSKALTDAETHEQLELVMTELKSRKIVFYIILVHFGAAFYLYFYDLFSSM
jgi:hypothetical protein